MEQPRQNDVEKITSGMMRFLGTVTRRTCDIFSVVVPSGKPRKVKTKIMGKRVLLEEERISPLTETIGSTKDTLAQSITKTDIESFSDRISFGSNLECMQAEICVDEKSFSFLSASLKDKDAKVRRQALNLLCCAYGNKSIPAILVSLHDVDTRVRKTAILLSKALKAKQAISALIILLSDENRDIQRHAAGALRKITGQNFDFKDTTSEESREKAINSWRLWWRDNQAEFSR